MYNISTNELQSNVLVSVQSKPRDLGSDLVHVTSWLPEETSIIFDPTQKLGVYAEVARGSAPVLGAEVVAIVERPQSVSLQIPLRDNGIGECQQHSDIYYANK